MPAVNIYEQIHPHVVFHLEENTENVITTTPLNVRSINSRIPRLIAHFQTKRSETNNYLYNNYYINLSRHEHQFHQHYIVYTFNGPRQCG